jgi:exonuclease III
MSSKGFFLAGILSFVVTIGLAQTESGNFKILFYNLENLFDVVDDSITYDENFTPDGEMHWTNNRLNTKINNISKVITAASGWNLPDILIFCEVENRYVLDKLINSYTFKKSEYRIIHKESPDHRGIDIAMLFKNDSFYPLAYQYYPLVVNGKTVATREMLYVSGIVNAKDTLHIFGNHWPSRYSGLLETKELRVASARLLREKIDEIQRKFQNSKIVVMGDFNENPQDFPILQLLNAEPVQEIVKSNSLYNLSSDWLKPGSGTMKFQSQWFVFDQIMVTGSLLDPQNGIFVKPEDAKIVDLPFLFQPDEKFGGKKLYRTYYGFDYQGGFSDHLPVIIDLQNN